MLTSIIVLLPSSLLAQEKEQAPDAEPAAAPTAIANKPALSMQDKQVPEYQQAWLTVGQQQHLAFYLAETSGNTFGGLVLIPDMNHHPATSVSINSLRNNLSDNHWHTLAVNMAYVDKDTAMEVITAAINYLNQQGVFNIALLGEGLGATQVMHYMAARAEPADQQVSQIRAMVMINGNNQLSAGDTKSLAMLEKIKLPILDAYTSSDYQQQQQAKDRKQAAKRYMNRFYQQLKLPPPAFQTVQADRTSKRIRGWLDKNAAGFMVDGR